MADAGSVPTPQWRTLSLSLRCGIEAALRLLPWRMIDLRRGDCFAPDGLPSLPDRSVDAILTDPPFDQRTHRAAVELGPRIEGKRSVAGELPFPPLDAAMLATLAQHFARVARRWIVVFSGERQIEAWAAAIEAAGARVVRVGLALRTNPRPQMSGDRPAPPADFLVIAYASPGRMSWNGGGKAGAWRSPPARFDTDGETVHPTQKPIALMRELVEDFTDPGELVCDPSAGSGSTAIACKELGRRFIGWEVSDAYHAVACARVLRAKEQLRLSVPKSSAGGGNG
jgi:site-specific DNA-methyltransferase (adenine-specific)